jgi:hypothetical protein
MIDPKLNEIPVEDSEEALPKVQGGKPIVGSRAGLSINDTIAGNASLSVGSRGVDTSGVASGAGVGAGMTMVTPGGSAGAPAPAIVPGARGSGTTIRGESDSAAPASAMPDTSGVAFSEDSSTTGGTVYTDEELAAEAYRCWHERGCPEGSPEVDWRRAQERLRVKRASA